MATVHMHVHNTLTSVVIALKNTSGFQSCHLIDWVGVILSVVRQQCI